MSEVISLREKVVQAELAARVLNLPPEREEMSTEADYGVRRHRQIDLYREAQWRPFLSGEKRWRNLSAIAEFERYTAPKPLGWDSGSATESSAWRSEKSGAAASIGRAL
jgi:hypothetical protein